MIFSDIVYVGLNKHLNCLTLIIVNEMLIERFELVSYTVQSGNGVKMGPDTDSIQ